MAIEWRSVSVWIGPRLSAADALPIGRDPVLDVVLHDGYCDGIDMICVNACQCAANW